MWCVFSSPRCSVHPGVERGQPLGKQLVHPLDHGGELLPRAVDLPELVGGRGMGRGFNRAPCRGARRGSAATPAEPAPAADVILHGFQILAEGVDLFGQLLGCLGGGRDALVDLAQLFAHVAHSLPCVAHRARQPVRVHHRRVACDEVAA